MAGSPASWLWLAKVKVDMLPVLSDEADEGDEEDDSGCGWLAGWQPNSAKPKIRRRGTVA